MLLRCILRPCALIGGPRPRALGRVHATDAGPGVRLGDGGAGEEGRFDIRDVRGLIPRTSL
jgi:hypothetical protein